MIYLLIDILFYSFSPFNTCFVLFNFLGKKRLSEYLIMWLFIMVFTRKIFYYLVLLSLLWVLNKYVLKKYIKNDLMKLIINFIIFFNFSMTLNQALVFMVMVLFHYLAPYNLLGD